MLNTGPVLGSKTNSTEQRTSRLHRNDVSLCLCASLRPWLDRARQPCQINIKTGSLRI